MKEPLISIIIPIYGVEDCIERCIESLVKQTYKNIEIILVDDGSKDNCPRIIDEWAQRDGRIIPMHKENGGQSSARNLGLEIMRGEYVSFVDGDDWVEPQYIEQLYKSVSTFNTLISVGLFQRVKGEKIQKEPFFKGNEGEFYSCSTQQAVCYFLEKFIAVWGKLYHVSLLKNLRFPIGRLAEEYKLQLEILKKVEEVSFCNYHLYNYRVRANSDSHFIRPKYMVDNIQAINEAYHICRISFANETEFCLRRLSTLLYVFLAAERFGAEEKQKYLDILTNAKNIVGGEEKCLLQLENGLDDIFYARIQFQAWLNSAEKKKLQRDYRKIYKNIKQQKIILKKKAFKWRMGYFSLSLVIVISKLIRR